MATSEAPLDRFPGKKAFINDTIEQVRVNLKALIADANMLSRAAVEGKLATRADASKHQGNFRKIVQGVDETLDSVINPLNVAATTSTASPRVTSPRRLRTPTTATSTPSRTTSTPASMP